MRFIARVAAVTFFVIQVLILQLSAGTPGTFAPGVQTYTRGATLSGITVADFNRDGKSDVAAVHSGSGVVTILLAVDRMGRFGEPEALPLPFRGYRIVNGDFNGDSLLDIAVGFINEPYLAVYAGRGDGKFEPMELVAIPSGAGFTLAAADVNLDGITDIVTNGTVLLGSKSTGFARLDVSIGGPIVVSDLNHDAKPDLIELNSFRVWLGHGDGTFSSLPLPAVGQHNLPQGAVAELNGDGNPDLVVVDQVTNQLFIRFGRGDGTFADGETFSTGGAPSAVAIADYDGDGRNDILVAHSGTNWVYIYPNLGDGTFGHASAGFKTLYPNVAMQVIDLNGDELPDVITGGTSPDIITVYRNSPEDSEDLCLLAGTPSVSFCNLISGATVSNPLRVLVATKSDSPVYDTVLYLDGVMTAKSPGSLLDTSVTMTPGSHRLVAQAWDASGRVLKSEITVNAKDDSAELPCPEVDAVPAVTICEPASGMVSTDKVRVVAGAKSDAGITAMKIYVDNVERYAAKTNRIYVSVPLTVGTHSIVVQAWDTLGRVFKASRQVTLQATQVNCDQTSIYPSIRFCGMKPGDKFGQQVRFVSLAQAPPRLITSSRLYVNDVEAYRVSASKLDTVVMLPLGTSRAVAQSWDSAGNVYKVTAITNCESVAGVVSCSIVSAGNQVVMSAPMANGVFNSAVPIQARAYTPESSVSAVKVYVDGKQIYQTTGDTLNIAVPLVPGLHQVTVQAWSKTGAVFNSYRIITVQ